MNDKTVVSEEKTQIDIVKNANLTDDAFFGLVMQDKAACQELVNTFLGTDFEIIDVKPQYELHHGMFRGSRYDIWAKDKDDHRINLEMQQLDEKNQFKRMRYYRGQTDTGTGALKQGEDFNKLRDFYAIFISQTDFIGDGKQIYVGKRYLESPEDPNYRKSYSEGAYEYYVNLTVKGKDNKINRLTDLLVNSSVENCTDEFSAISWQIKYYKENPKGVEIMRSQFDERVSILKDCLRDEKEAKEKANKRAKEAEEQAKAAKEQAQKEEQEKIFSNIDTLLEFNVKGKEIEQRLSTKFGMTTEQAKAWIRKYEEYKTSRGSQI